MTMEMALGMSEAEANDTGLRGTDQGMQIKTTYGWSNAGNGTNSSGFAGLPGGLRGWNGGGFDNAGYGAYWWSSSPIGSAAWVRFLFNGQDGYRGIRSLPSGYTVRCIRDAE